MASKRDSDISKCKSKRQQVFFIWLGILLAVERGEYAAQIARNLNKSPQRISYHVAELKELGYIEKRKRSYPDILQLTEKAKSFLAVLSNEKRRARFRFHHFAFKYRITRDSPDFLPVSEGTRLRGGVVQVDGKVDGYSVRRFASPCGQWLFLYSAPVFGDEPWRLLCDASIALHCLAQEICRRHNMELKRESIMQKPEFDVPSDKFAKYWGQNYGATVKTPDGDGIDASPPGSEWSTELSVEDAAAYVHIARNVADIAQLVRQQGETLDVLEKGSVTQTQRMDKLTDTMILEAAQIRKLAESVDKFVTRFESWMARGDREENPAVSG
jgi:DNA-binding transcriptional ArsR family regulator